MRVANCVVTLCLISCLIRAVCSDVTYLTQNCPSKYRLTTGESGDIAVRIKRNPSFCTRQMGGAGIRTQTGDLKPRRGIPYMKNGEYYHNITWQVRRDQNKKFPKKIVLSLQYAIPGRNTTDQECIILKLKNTETVKNKSTITMYFDCIKLQDDVDTAEVTVQLWQVPTKCPERRRKRSSSSCGQITTSRPKHYSISLESYKHKICSCYYSCGNSKPQSNVTVLYEGGRTVNFKIAVSNLPSFTRTIDIELHSNKGQTWTYNSEVLPVTQNGSLMFVTGLDTYTEGTTYTVMLYYECMKGRHHDIMLPSSCFSSDKFVLDNGTEITYMDKPHQLYHTEQGLHLAVSVSGGVVVVVALFIIGVIVLRRTRSNRKANMPSNTLEVISDESSNLIIPDNDSPAIHLHHPDIEPLYQHIADMLTDSGIVLKDGRDENWREFSTNQITPYVSNDARSNIILFLTCGLHELLYGDCESKHKRLAERQYENVPANILNTLKTLPDASRQKVVLHFVSSNNYKGRQLTQDFLEKDQILVTSVMCHTYYFQQESLDSEQNQHELQRLTHNIRSR